MKKFMIVQLGLILAVAASSTAFAVVEKNDDKGGSNVTGLEAKKKNSEIDTAETAAGNQTSKIGKNNRDIFGDKATPTNQPYTAKQYTDTVTKLKALGTYGKYPEVKAILDDASLNDQQKIQAIHDKTGIAIDKLMDC